jgi:branched-chain amino acid transport system substrate-binding protein
MKRSRHICMITVLILIWACGPKIVISTEPYERQTPLSDNQGIHLFSQAEKKLKEGFYEDALSRYQQYYSQFPNSPFADAALMKTGDIYSIIGKSSQAHQSYKKLAREYPQSIYKTEALIESAAALYHAGRYQDTIDSIEQILRSDLQPKYRIRLFALLGDTYTALGATKEAVRYYISAISQLKGDYKNIITTKLKQVIRQLSSADISLLLSQLDDSLAKGHLLFQLATYRYEEGKYESALTALAELIERYPTHEVVQQASLLKESIEKESLANRFAIGCLLPLSGRYQVLGDRALKGIQLAMEHVKSKTAKTPIRIVIKDTQSDPDQAITAVNELAAEHVAAIIGPIFTAESAAKESQALGIPIITLTQKEKITEIGDYVFRNFITPQAQVKTMLSYVIDKMGLTRFAIIYPDETYGTTFMNLFWDEVIAQGGSITGVESYGLNQTDFGDCIKKLVGLHYKYPDYKKRSRSLSEGKDGDRMAPVVDFDAVFIPDAPQKTGLIIPQLAFHDIENIQLLGTNLWHSSKLIQMARPYIQNAIVPEGFFIESESPALQDFVSRFTAAFGEAPGFIEAVAYDCAMILFQLASKPEIRFRDSLKDELIHLTDFPGVTGLTSYDYSGEVIKKPFLLQVKGDKFVEIQTD